MKKISILLALLMAMSTGYLFSAPRPPDMPWTPQRPPPRLVGHWEGTGNFLLTNLMVPPGEETTRTVEVEVFLDIDKKDGNNFIGKITARYQSLLPWDHGQLIHVGIPEMPLGGQIQGDPGSPKRPVNMVSGFGDAGNDSAKFVVEIDGQYEAKVSPAQVTLTCRWRGMNFYADGGGWSGEPSVGEFTVILQPPPSNVD